MRLVAWLLVGAAVLAGLMWVTPLVWKPWVSPHYAAQQLAADDGKGLVYWMPSAARFWGHRIYEPLAEATEGFDELRPTAAYTLMDILTVDEPDAVMAVYPKLLASRSRRARLLGCYAAMKHRLAVASVTDRCSTELRDTLSQEASIESGSVIEFALRVVGQAQTAGMSDLIAAHLSNEKAPYWVRVEACKAAASLPERASFKEAVSKLEAHVREGCQEAAATIASS